MQTLIYGGEGLSIVSDFSCFTIRAMNQSVLDLTLSATGDCHWTDEDRWSPVPGVQHARVNGD